MVGSEWQNTYVGGSPAEGVPFRQESFNYGFDSNISDLERLVLQGRIHADTQTVGSKYWGSYLQGQQKPMD